jgi:hypothetical protein
MATKNTVLRRSPHSKSAVIIRRLRAYRFHRPLSPRVVSIAALLETCRRRGIFVAR